MDESVKFHIDYLCEDLDGAKDSVLIYGDPEMSNSILNGVYKKLKTNNEYLCTWHDADNINEPMDFFKPILKEIYKKEYQKIINENWFKQGDFGIASLCIKESLPKINKLPIIFIDGIEKLFFKIDFGNLDKLQLINLFSLGNQPLPNGFGDCLRGELHQTNSAIFYGIVSDSSGIEYLATLGNYEYLFYQDNFRQVNIS